MPIFGAVLGYIAGSIWAFNISSREGIKGEHTRASRTLVKEKI
jgi:hypothetical protein